MLASSLVSEAFFEQNAMAMVCRLRDAIVDRVLGKAKRHWLFSAQSETRRLRSARSQGEVVVAQLECGQNCERLAVGACIIIINSSFSAAGQEN